MKTFNIPSLSQTMQAALQQKIDQKTKPIGALGQLENLALQIALIQKKEILRLTNPHIIVFAGDHGIAAEGVSAYPQEVTFQMVMNFLNGGAAINVFCRQHGIGFTIVDAGVNYEFPLSTNLIHLKMGKGTRNFLKEPAMRMETAQECIHRGAALVQELFRSGCNVIGFGEMGIANTSSASALMSLLCNIPVEECIGKGSGLTEEQLEHKIGIIRTALTRHTVSTPLEILASFGGFEIAQMCGAMLQAAECQMLVLVDGFISSAAFLVAYTLYPEIRHYAIFCHQSDETGHKKMLDHLNVKALLNLHMRLGEGSGIALAYPLIQSAVHFFNEMASFESAGVSTKEITADT
jgi:nicotinate-nucleotide--dimethylbenzimidazole phosphoribosyltransferase